MKKSTGDNFFPKDMSFPDGVKLLKNAGYDGWNSGSETDLGFR